MSNLSQGGSKFTMEAKLWRLRLLKTASPDFELSRCWGTSTIHEESIVPPLEYLVLPLPSTAKASTPSAPYFSFKHHCIKIEIESSIEQNRICMTYMCLILWKRPYRRAVPFKVYRLSTKYCSSAIDSSIEQTLTLV